MPFIALDWGTSRFRAVLCTLQGEVIEQLESGEGIAHLPLKNFEEVLLSRCAPWFRAHKIKNVLASGMITSKNGWHELRYVDAPASLSALKMGAKRFSLTNGVEMVLLTGVRDASAKPFPDVMRGEETQIMGLGQENGLVIAPGTHSKWVFVENNAIMRFTTYATGELYQTILTHSFIGGFAKQGEFNEVAFMRGCAVVQNLPHHEISSLIFSVRTGFLVGELTAETSADYLSGLLIAKEFQEAMRAYPYNEARLIASPELAGRYKLIAPRFGVKLIEGEGNLALQGMIRILA